MLDNVKLVLGIENDRYDKLIILYINKISEMVLEYCSRQELSTALEGFVEEKVISILSSRFEELKKNSGLDNLEKSLKAITRGDTKIEYNALTLQTAENSISSSSFLTDTDKKFLSPFCIVSMY
ncbi:phage head-tail connector protein [Clostridioides difficile]|nr:phage head-tail connector protein [Clostridioides difficile]EQE72873.1 phage gp6-like head-tail connector family protein [Clostridioides difficile CD51]EQF90156.1 phage gp6-like head-tail connector family protein [Clostridioides difficile 655]EQG05384.1 phage gp6-like head-tail connector family protein [Clostridioides difficile 6042]EQG46193.1 phage gp6-like head-tail connector family protein [Clostridioides difficile DA00132]EQH50640.1 phage gp6-like head-tail connector family protein [Clo